uniref:RING-type domain-containing protein n=1 Tax=Rhabditophanes sp. KR3021 TaxID=114890 RepID=A0AC35UG07_9BILA
MSLPVAIVPANSQTAANNEPNKASKKKRNRRPNKKAKEISSQIHDIVHKLLQNTNTLTAAIAENLKLQNISTSHICEGLPRSLSFLHACEICFESREFFGMLPCNHSACIQCLIKQTMFSGKISCCQCRDEHEGLVFFRVTSKFPSQYPPVDIGICKRRYKSKLNVKLQKKFNIVLGCTLTIQAYDYVLGHRCHICDKSDKDYEHKTFDRLKKHYWNKHRRKFCDLCCDYEKKFSCERIPFTSDELDKHLAGKKTNWGDLATDGHALCTFCKNKHFYSTEDRFRHYRVDHQTCEICLKDKNEFAVFENFNALLSHYKNKHFLCDDVNCRNAGICFSSNHELQLHVADVHKSGARTQAVPMSFPFASRNARRSPPLFNSSTNNVTANRQRLNSTSNSNGLGGINLTQNRTTGLSADAFPSLLSAPVTKQNKEIQGNTWGTSNTQKLIQNLVKKPEVIKPKELPKPCPYDHITSIHANRAKNSQLAERQLNQTSTKEKTVESDEPAEIVKAKEEAKGLRNSNKMKKNDLSARSTNSDVLNMSQPKAQSLNSRSDLAHFITHCIFDSLMEFTVSARYV